MSKWLLVQVPMGPTGRLGKRGWMGTMELPEGEVCALKVEKDIRTLLALRVLQAKEGMEPQQEVLLCQASMRLWELRVASQASQGDRARQVNPVRLVPTLFQAPLAPRGGHLVPLSLEKMARSAVAAVAAVAAQAPLAAVAAAVALEDAVAVAENLVSQAHRAWASWPTEASFDSKVQPSLPARPGMLGVAAREAGGARVGLALRGRMEMPVALRAPRAEMVPQAGRGAAADMGLSEKVWLWYV